MSYLASYSLPCVPYLPCVYIPCITWLHHQVDCWGHLQALAYLLRCQAQEGEYPQVPSSTIPVCAGEAETDEMDGTNEPNELTYELGRMRPRVGAMPGG